MATDKVYLNLVDELRTWVHHPAFSFQQRLATIAWITQQPSLDALRAQTEKARKLIGAYRTKHNLAPVQIPTPLEV